MTQKPPSLFDWKIAGPAIADSLRTLNPRLMVKHPGMVVTIVGAMLIGERGGGRSAVAGGTRVLSDEIKIRFSIKPGEGFLDRMIALVEGASRQKTPNEIALTILLSALTLIFLLVCITLKPFGIYSAADFSIPVLIALLVCLIPTTIGGLVTPKAIARSEPVLQRHGL